MSLSITSDWGVAVDTAVRQQAGTEQTVEVLSDIARLREMRSEWNATVRAAGIDHPFLDHEWICTWWECFGAGKKLHILLVRDDSPERRLVGIAPLMLESVRMYGMPIRQLVLLRNDHTPRADIVCVGDAPRICRTIWNYLLARAPCWNLLLLPQVLQSSPVFHCLPALAQEVGYRVGIWQGEISPYVPLRGDWDHYFQGLSYNHRARVRRGLSRLQRRGNVQLEVVTATDAVASALEQGMLIEAAAWKARAGTAIASQVEVTQFYQSLAQRLAATNILHLYFLTVAGIRIAFSYGLCVHNKIYVLKAGYDPAYAYYSPYILLCYLVFQQGSRQGLDEYEFLGRNESWKLDWTSLTRAHDWLYLFAPGVRTRLLYSIKFCWLPALQKRAGYLWLRDHLFSAIYRLGCRMSKQVRAMCSNSVDGKPASQD